MLKYFSFTLLICILNTLTGCSSTSSINENSSRPVVNIQNTGSNNLEKEVSIIYSSNDPITLDSLSFINKDKFSITVFSNGKRNLIKDGKVIIDTYENIYTPKYSPNGDTFIFVGKNSDGQVLVKNNQVSSMDCQVIDELIFSEDGQSIAYVCSNKNGGTGIIKDGVYISAGYEQVSFPTYFSGSEGFAFVGLKDGKLSILQNGISLENDFNNVGAPTYSSNNKSFAFTASKGLDSFLVNNGVKSSNYDSLGGLPYSEKMSSRPIYSSDGKSITFEAKIGQKWTVIKDGIDVGESYEEVRSPRYSLDGKYFAFIAENKDGIFIVQNGIQITSKYRDIGSFQYLADGKSIIFVASTLDGKYEIIQQNI